MHDLLNKWNKVYWFARMLINNDKYGGIGKETKLILHLSGSLRLIATENNTLDELEVLKLQKQLLTSILLDRFSKSKVRQKRIKKLCEDINTEIVDLKDMSIFILTCESVMVPINQAISNIPSDDKEFTLSIAKMYLDNNKEKGLATVINLWDDLGVKGCLSAERLEIIKAFAVLRELLTSTEKLSLNEMDVVQTAFVQEFERRAAQKRKGRAGGSLEDVTSFILDYFNINSYNAPEHFQADIEIDNWIKLKDKWLIGISCKRTLRERWKQVSSADASILSKFKIKKLFHIITYDEDLSDEKISLLGSQRHVFYLPDDSRILKRSSNHIGLKDYVRPISCLIKDIKKEI